MPSSRKHELDTLRGEVSATGLIYTDTMATLRDDLTEIEDDINDLDAENLNTRSRCNVLGKVAHAALKLAGSSLKTVNSVVSNFKSAQEQGIWIYNSSDNKAMALGSGTGSASIVKVDDVDEFNSGHGVDIDGLNLKDGKCDGRDVSTDGTKLDTIATSADVTGSNTPQAHTATSHTNRTRTLFIGSHYYTTGGTAEIGVELDASTDEKVAYRFQLPKDFVSLTSIQVCWSEDAWDTNDHAWVLDVNIKAGVPPYVWNQHGNVDNGNIIAVGAYEQNYLDYFTIASVCFTNIDENDIVTVILNRDANNGNDTFNQDIAILGLKITYVAEE